MRELRFGGAQDAARGRHAMSQASSLLLSHDGASIAAAAQPWGSRAGAVGTAAARGVPATPHWIPDRSALRTGTYASPPRGPLALHSSLVWEAARA